MKVEWRVFPAFYKHFFREHFPFFHKQILTPTDIELFKLLSQLHIQSVAKFHFLGHIRNSTIAENYNYTKNLFIVNLTNNVSVKEPGVYIYIHQKIILQYITF